MRRSGSIISSRGAASGSSARRKGMNIFTRFGFQMVVATPLKSVMTLEPFIGGACFVHIKDRKSSSILTIDYDEANHRLVLPDSLDHGPEAALA